MERILAVRDEVVRAVAPLAEAELPLGLDAASGRFLAADATARVASPPRACAAMDGYAVRAGEALPGAALRVAETLFAGDGGGRVLGRGEAARIFTGAPLPAGADAVVMQEHVARDGDLVRIAEPARAGENVRHAGEDLQGGAVALQAGVRLGARQLALLAAVGVERVRVFRSPRVAVISTGEEIVRRSIADSNGPAVAGILRAAGAEVDRLAVGDGLDELVEALARAVERADAVVTIGGVSVGERDHVASAVVGAGGRILVHGVPMKPGKPFLLALAGAKPILGLPGSPSACLVALEVFARPVVLRLAGAARPWRRSLALRLAEATPGKRGRARFLWARIEPDGRVRPLGRDAAQIRGPALADALVRVPEDAGDLAEGSEVEAWLLDDDA
jgi:molybdopterin molybdotransferase